ncbi:MAG: type VII secretion target [Actinomycetota bacterium]|nr:type VII secretion target [Actinomycetota bacterium]
MGDGYNVDVEQLRAHARNVDAIQARFGAVRSASGHIAQDDQAYGLLCGWIAGVLEGRHTRQDELIAYVEENLALVATALRVSVDDYEAVEDTNAGLIRSAGGEGTA